MTEPTGLWVYAVAERAPETGLPTGIGGLPVRSFAADGLVAVVSEVGMSEFGESALRANLEDLVWLEATAKAHHQVIDDLASTQPVVPMRLATVFHSEASLRAMLAARRHELHEVLDRIGQRREWGVKVFAATADRTPKTRADAERGAVAAAGSGAAYLQRRRTELDASQRARHEEARSAEEVHAALCQLAADSRLHPPQVPQLAGTKAPMLLNAAYLLDEASERRFSDAVLELAQQHRAIRLQMTGPWPPYSFASLDATLEAQP
ncbi:MAG TPA: GvpL/GvpF family gas vesicle protein [Streptosporangiaceae bacterium]|nr:GvpL/GvpF family gas vesicle protein [Streptosporangiaceae bacterium]